MPKEIAGVTLGTFIRTGILVLALINTTLQLMGLEVLPFAPEDVELFLTALFNAVAALLVWWKNNSFTREAKEADEIMRSKKKLK